MRRVEPNIVKVSERIRDHLTRQHKLSRNYSELCLYRGPGGLLCAVGCLITNEHYNAGLECTGIEENEVFDAVLASLAEDDIAFDKKGEKRLLKLLINWQAYHDSRDEPAENRYEAWCNGEGERSPVRFHEIVMGIMREGSER